MKETTNQIQRDPQIAQFVSSLEPEVPEVESDPGEGLVTRLIDVENTCFFLIGNQPYMCA